MNRQITRCLFRKSTVFVNVKVRFRLCKGVKIMSACRHPYCSVENFHPRSTAALCSTGSVDSTGSDFGITPVDTFGLQNIYFLSVFSQTCDCVCIPIFVTTLPEWLSGTEPLPHTPRCRASVLVVFVVFCVHMHSFAV